MGVQYYNVMHVDKFGIGRVVDARAKSCWSLFESPLRLKKNG